MNHLDIYPLPDSSLFTRLENLLEDEKDFSLYQFSQNEIINEKNHKHSIVIIEENSSFLESESIFEKICAQYAKFPIVIILSANNDMFNVVKWMRKGVADCFWIGNLKKYIIINSIKESIAYIENSNHNSKESVMKSIKTRQERVVIPAEIKWETLENNQYYDLTLVLIKIVFSHNTIGRYSTKSIEKIDKLIKSEAAKIAEKFGGRLWNWQNNCGLFVYHFGDKTNCAVLMGVSFYLQFFLLCLEKLGLEEIFQLKIAVHNGIGIYHQTNTEQITSELVNSIYHLVSQYPLSNSLIITEEVFSQLSPRLTKSFVNGKEFEGRDIYIHKWYQS